MHHDLRTALRSLRGSPNFTVIALVILALGIGAGTAVFSVVDAVVLRGLPFDHADRIAVVLEHDTKKATTFGGGATTPQTYLDWRRLQTSFEGLAAVSSWSFRVRNERGEPADARALRITPEFFRALRTSPVIGRSFSADDEVEGRHRVAILSYGYWQRQFGGSREVLGKMIDLSDERWEIVGVMPRGFAYPVASDRPTEIYAPVFFRADEKARGASRNFNWTVIGRLKDGVTFDQANGQMNRISAALDEQYPKWGPGRRARVLPLHQHLVGKVKPWMLMLLGAVGVVLLIACANVANLMLARATVRAREMGVRAALGATRWRLIRALLVEGVVLSLAGAALGVLLAYLGVRVLKAWLPADLPRVASIAIDVRVLGASIAAAVTTGLFFGIVPALHSSRPDLTRVLNDSGRASTAGAGHQRLRGMLIVAEVALAVVLLVGAGLFIGSFVRLMRVETGFDHRNLLAFDVGVRVIGRNYKEAAERGRTYLPLVLGTVRRVPGVELAGMVSGGLPLTGSWSRNSISVPGQPEIQSDDSSIDTRAVTPDYLEALRIPLVRGRYLNTDDRAGAPRVVLLNQTAARKYFPGRDALGQRVRISGDDLTVVGIVGDIRHLGPETPPRQECYRSMLQDPEASATLVIRTRGDPLAVLPAVKAAIWSIDRDQRISGDSLTLEGYLDRLIAERRFNMALLVTFGVLGLVIAAVGIYGVMAYTVAQRTSEIGVRMALGATPGTVVSMVLRQAALLILAGLGIGGAGAWYLASSVNAFLFETQANDPRVFVLALVVLAAAGLAAGAVPARRAARVDPLVALRQG